MAKKAKKAKKQLQFRPDPTGAGFWSKLYIPQSQRKKIDRWTLYSLLCIAILVVQDVVLSQLKLFGGMVDLTPCVIMLVCVMEGADNGSVFALLASIFYLFSGTAPGAYCILLITFLGVVAAMFRQNFLRRTFGSFWLCNTVVTFLYQISVYSIALFLGQTYAARAGAFAMNAVLASSVLPVVYPVFGAIYKIGGETWKE